jgi:replication factor A2
MPATIRLLVEAQKTVEEKGTELQLHGAEVANVTLVGVVEGLLRQATLLEFTLNDGSGRIKVRHYQNSDGAADPNKDGLIVGRYASVVGSLRTSPAVHVSALSLRPVTTADEVSYHMIEVAHAALMMKRGGSRAPVSSPASAVPQPQAAIMQAPVVPAPAAAAPPAAVAQANLRDAVLAVLRSEGESRPEGVPRATILDRLKSSPAGSVGTVLEELVAEGEAFTTFDDDHFSGF